MSLFETESIILRSYDLADADKIVVLLTRDHGVVRGVAKGAKRLKSKFGSGLEPFSFVNATYFEKETSELVSIQKIEITESNFAAASDPDFLHKFSYLADLLMSILAPHDPNETVFRMVKASISVAAADGPSAAAIGVYFELWLLKLSGYLPDWSRCDRCGNAFQTGEPASLMSNSHLSCDGCSRSHRRLGGGERGLVVAALKLSPAEFSRVHAADADAIRNLSVVLKSMISEAIGREVVAEKIFSRSI